MEKEIIQFTISNLSLYISTIQMLPERKYRDMHLHDAVELIRVEKGELDCYINDEVLHLCAEHMLLVNSHIAHRLVPATAAQITYIQIDISKRVSEDGNTALNILAEYIGHVHNRPYGVFESNAELSSIFDAIQYEAASKETAYESYIEANIYHLIAFMRRNNMLSTANMMDLPGLSDLLPVIEFININYPYKLRLEGLAAIIHRDKYQLCRQFKKVTHGTVTDYCNFVRLRAAQRMLSSTGKNVTETSLACGFASIQYFNRVFRQYTGFSPSVFKKMVSGRHIV